MYEYVYYELHIHMWSCASTLGEDWLFHTSRSRHFFPIIQLFRISRKILRRLLEITRFYDRWSSLHARENLTLNFYHTETNWHLVSVDHSPEDWVWKNYFITSLCNPPAILQSRRVRWKSYKSVNFTSEEWERNTLAGVFRRKSVFSPPTFCHSNKSPKPPAFHNEVIKLQSIWFRFSLENSDGFRRVFDPPIFDFINATCQSGAWLVRIRRQVRPTFFFFSPKNEQTRFCEIRRLQYEIITGLTRVTIYSRLFVSQSYAFSFNSFSHLPFLPVSSVFWF